MLIKVAYTFKFMALWFLSFFSFAHVREVYDYWVVWTNGMRREKIFCVRWYDAEWGWRTLLFMSWWKGMSLGLHEPTWWYGRPWQFAHMWASLKKCIYTCPSLVIFRSILVVSKRGIQYNNYFHKISCLKWNVALVSNFNTRSQLG